MNKEISKIELNIKKGIKSIESNNRFKLLWQGKDGKRYSPDELDMDDICHTLNQSKNSKEFNDLFFDFINLLLDKESLNILKKFASQQNKVKEDILNN